MSRVKVNEITNKVATGPVDFPDGITGVALTVTGNVTVGGTIISEDTTNVDSVGWVTARSGLNVGPPSTGIGATIHSNGDAVFAGVCTATSFSGSGANLTGITALSGSTNNTVATVTGANALIGEANLTFDGELLTVNGGTNDTPLIVDTTNVNGAHMRFRTNGGTQHFVGCGGGISLGDNEDLSMRSYDNLLFATGNSSTERLRITSTGGVNFSNGELIENCNVTAGKLSDNQTINLDNGMVHLFTTTETTTATPNIMSTAGINTSMSNGDAITVTLITTAAAGAYCANIQIDGAAVTENWIGGSAPSDGGSSGVDVHTFSIIKTASATFTVLGNQSKTS